MENLTAVLVEKDNIRLENRGIPSPGGGEVLLRMDSVGICGSDVHYWTHGAIGDFVVRAPMVLGHEAAGVIDKVGPGVTDLKPGDRVAIEPGFGCRNCGYCKSGKYNLCPDMKFNATPPVDGSLCRFYKHPSDFCHKLPDNVSLEEGALMEPLSVGVHACNRARVGVHTKRVLITGAGPIGLVNLLTAKAMGAAEVYMTDISESRLKVARELGADGTLLVKPGLDTAEGLAETLSTKFMDGDLADATIECSGAESSVRLGVLATRSGGTLVLVGLGPAEIKLPIVNAACREVDIRGIFRYVNCYPTAISMVATGKVNVKPLITHRYTLEETVKAFENAKTGANGAIKVMISCKN